MNHFSLARRTRFMLACSLVAAGTADPGVASSMQFSTINTSEEKFVQITMHGGQVRIFAEGDIHEETAEQFQSFVQRNQISHAKVHFNSEGGSLIGGLRLGSIIRDLGFDTEVKSKGWKYGDPPNAICASACAYAYAGGVSRFYNDKAGRLGLHQFYLSGGGAGDLGQGQSMSGLLVAYLQRMGVDPLTFVVASRTGSTDMVWLSAADVEAIALANNGTQPTTAEIRMTDGKPYLRLEQEHHNVTSRVILFCVDGSYSIAAGIVTRPDVTQEHAHWQHRAYLELDGVKKFVLSGPESTKAVDSVLWIDRDLTANDARQLLGVKTLGTWVENGGPMRWGAMMDLSPVRERIAYFLSNCS